MQRIVIAVTGASGSIYAKLLLDKLTELQSQIEDVAVVLSANAVSVAEQEIGYNLFKNYPFQFFDQKDFYAPFASGSSGFKTMVVVPCSMGTLGRIAGGISNDLITRAADVMLKERRKLILAVREMPYNLVHIRNMETVTIAGGIICPCTPSFYSKPLSLDALAQTVVDRIIDLMGLENKAFRWGGDSSKV